MKIISFFTIFILFFDLFGLSTIEGKISVKGNDPHTYLTLTTKDNKEYSIVGKFKKEIWEKYQNQSIKVQGKIIKKAIGPGFPAEFEVSKIVEIKDN